MHPPTITHTHNDKKATFGSKIVLSDKNLLLARQASKLRWFTFPPCRRRRQGQLAWWVLAPKTVAAWPTGGPTCPTETSVRHLTRESVFEDPPVGKLPNDVKCKLSKYSHIYLNSVEYDLYQHLFTFYFSIFQITLTLLFFQKLIIN